VNWMLMVLPSSSPSVGNPQPRRAYGIGFGDDADDLGLAADRIARSGNGACRLASRGGIFLVIDAAFFVSTP